MKISQVVGVLDAHNRQVIPAYLGKYPKGALLIQFEDCDKSKINKPLLHDEQFAYWNSRRWNVVDAGGICYAKGKLVQWIVIADGRKLIRE